MSADRPEATKAGEVSLNVPETVVTSVDQIFDYFGLPEPGPAFHRLLPDSVADAAGVPTPDDISDEILAQADGKLNVSFPHER